MLGAGRIARWRSRRSAQRYGVPEGFPSASMACDINAYPLELTSAMYMIWFPSGDHVMS